MISIGGWNKATANFALETKHDSGTVQIREKISVNYKHRMKYVYLFKQSFVSKPQSAAGALFIASLTPEILITLISLCAYLLFVQGVLYVPATALILNGWAWMDFLIMRSHNSALLCF